MEPPHHGPDPVSRYARAQRNIIREAGVEAGSKAPAKFETPCPRCPAVGTFGCDVDCVGPEVLQPTPNRGSASSRESDFVIGRARPIAKQARLDNFNHMATALEMLDRHCERAHHAIDLRRPSVGSDYDSHAATPCLALSFAASARLRAAQSMISICPLACSTNAVQLSTQSPS